MLALTRRGLSLRASHWSIEIGCAHAGGATWRAHRRHRAGLRPNHLCPLAGGRAGRRARRPGVGRATHIRVAERRRSRTVAVMHTHDREPLPTRWFDSSAVYQIYVRSFCDGDGDGVGDLEGIIARADHIASLSVDAVWLTPCYPSPQADHGYDVADYTDIHHEYGDLATFDRLVAALAQRGVRTLLDIVPNHCSSQHPWFLAALAAGPGSPERQRFYFADGRGEAGELPPNNWLSVFGGSAWTRIIEPDGQAGQWYLHMFASQQPDWNWEHPDVADLFDNALTFWLDRGASGFRVDAIAFAGKAPGLPDMPEAPAGRDTDIWKHNDKVLFRPEAHRYWRRWRETIERWQAANPQREPVLLICEAYTPKEPEKLAPFLAGDQFHQAFSFDLLLEPWSPKAWRQTIKHQLEAFTTMDTRVVWTLNNHDVQRAATRYGRADATDSYTGNNLVYSDAQVDLRIGLRRARAAFAFVAALPGAVYLYQGEELGLPEYLAMPDVSRQDPIFHRTGGVEKGRDGCRIPLPWGEAAANSHSFSLVNTSAPPWLPQPAGWGSYAPDSSGKETLALYRNVMKLRPRLSGELELIDSPDGTVAFRRQQTVVILNMSDLPVELPAVLREARLALDTSRVREEDDLLGLESRARSEVLSATHIGPNTCLYLELADAPALFRAAQVTAAL